MAGELVFACDRVGRSFDGSSGSSLKCQHVQTTRCEQQKEKQDSNGFHETSVKTWIVAKSLFYFNLQTKEGKAFYEPYLLVQRLRASLEQELQSVLDLTRSARATRPSEITRRPAN